MGYLPARVTQQPQQPTRIDPSIGADCAWIATLGNVAGPRTTPVGATGKVASPGGIAINSGYAVVAAPIPSMHTTTWTECGVVLLDGTNQLYSLSSRATGQAVNFQPASNRVDLIIWTLVDVFIIGTLPVGIVHYVARRVGSAHTIWLNGKLYGTASSASTPVASSGILPAIGAQAGSGGNIGLTPLTATTGMLSVVRTQIALPDAQCLALSNNHWQVYQSPQRRLLVDVPTAGGITGTLAATEAADSGTASGSVLIDCTLARTEGADSAIASGFITAPISGTLAVTEGAETGAASGSVLVSGATAATEGADSLIAAGSTMVDGTLAVAEVSDTVTAVGTVASGASGTLAAVEGSDSASGSGSVLVSGELAASEGADVLVALGNVLVSGNATAGEQPDTLAATGSVVGAITGLMAATEAPDTLVAYDTAPSVASGGGAGDWRSVRDFADRLDKASRPPKPTKAAKKKRREQLEEVALELLPDLPAARLIAPVIAQAVYRKEAAAVARWTPPQAMQPVIKPNASAVEQAAELEAEALAAEFDAAEAIRAMVEQWQKNEAIARELEREAEEESEIEMLLLG